MLISDWGCVLYAQSAYNSLSNLAIFCSSQRKEKHILSYSENSKAHIWYFIEHIFKD